MQKFNKGFTLAEVLITLAIIGVVAAMTIPTLIAKINNIVTDNQTKVFNAKLIKGLNLTKTAGDLNDTYTNTYDFLVNGLGKNLKMAKICDKDHIKDCIPYDKIKYDKGDGTEETVNVADLKTAKKLKLKTPFEDTAAFVLADGTPAIVSYNLKCIDDPDKADTAINGCLAGIYDLNGTRKPNKFGVKVDGETTSYINDLRGFNGAAIGGGSCLGDVCISSTAIGGTDAAYDTMFAAIQEVDPSYVRPKFGSSNDMNDNWQMGKDYCEKVGEGHMPSEEEIKDIARALYDNKFTSNNMLEYRNTLTMINKEAVYSALGVEPTAEYIRLWYSDTPFGPLDAYFATFQPKTLSFNYNTRDLTSFAVICIQD